MDDPTPLRFIGEEIHVTFDRPPALKKAPPAPSMFHWRGRDYRVEAVAATWFDYERKGRSARNMSPEHLRTAAARGSWGVGRFYFRVRTTEGQVFDLYYDRAPKDAGDRGGRWFLWRELDPG